MTTEKLLYMPRLDLNASKSGSAKEIPVNIKCKQNFTTPEYESISTYLYTLVSSNLLRVEYL